MAMKQKHTPDPWKAETVNLRQRSSWQATYLIRRESGGAVFAEVGPHDGDYQDARLIASAPDLLEALKRLLQHSLEANKDYDATTEAANAIARAEGQV